MPDSPNARLFIWFRLFFNCRFYYPVFTILFLDLGLSIGEFAALNVVWALTSVVLEVPSGALADRFGRRPLVIAAGVLMVLEMSVLCLMQPGHHDLVFWLFVLNRVLSGAAEACASGADEALAYDSLPEGAREALWPRVMANLSRAMAVGFVISSITGAWLYTISIKLPVLLCLATAIASLVCTLRMTESWTTPKNVPLLASIRETWASILRTGGWIWRTRAAFALIVFGLVFDSMIRLFLTVASNFYRLVGIEEGWFGVIGTCVSLLGLFTASLMEKATRRMSGTVNFTWLALVVLGGLFAAAYPAQGWSGVVLVVPLFLGMRFLQFFLSHYMNAVVDSAQRATALSFRGLTINLSYGLTTLLFGWHTGHLAKETGLPTDDIQVFAGSLKYWPWWFAGTLLIAGACVLARRFGKTGDA
ncbi:MAG: MFS transporter [Verrucomicrobiaceae bacterium]|nr:MFS transporter [Verrucomicrobiaceae bacterium]